MLPDYRDGPWRERVLYAIPGITAALLWVFTALHFRPGVDLLLLFAILLAGVGLLVQMTLYWARGRSSVKLTLAAWAVGVVMMGFASLELAHQPQAPGPLRVLLQMLMLVSLAYMVRVQRQEKDIPR